MAAWHDVFRSARERSGLSQEALAQRAGLSEETISSWERGKRRPSQRSLARALDAVAPSGAVRDEILRLAGFEADPPPRLRRLQDLRVGPTYLNREIAAYPWPCLVLNEHHEIVAWNAPATRVAEMDFAARLPQRWQRNLMRITTMPHFRDRVVNWEEIAAKLISVLKNDQVSINVSEEDKQYYATVMTDIARDHPDVLSDLFRLWNTVEPQQEGGRLFYNPVWRVEDGSVLRFNTVTSGWDDFDATWASDWQPADAGTWRWLTGSGAGLVPAQHPDETSKDVGLLTDDAGAPAMAGDAMAASSSLGRMLRTARRDARMTQRELAEVSGLAEATISAYERGARRPTREHLLAFAYAAQLDTATTNVALRDLGYDPEPSDWALFVTGMDRRNPYDRHRHWQAPDEWRDALVWSPAQIEQEVGQHRWPCFVTNQQCEIVVSNRAAQQVLNLRLNRDLPRPEDRHVLRFVLGRYFRDHVANWDDVADALLPGALSQPFRDDRTPAAAALRRVMRELRSADPELIGRLTELWRRARPTMLTNRLVIPIQWKHDDSSSLAFNCIASPWGLTGGWALDWHPADAATWDRLGTG